MVGQSNPTGIEPRTEKHTIALTPYVTAKDLYASAMFCMVWAWFVFYIPTP